MNPRLPVILALTLAILGGYADVLWAADPAAREQAAALFEQARALYNEGQYAEAAAVLEENEAVFRRAGQLADMYGFIAGSSIWTRDFKGAEQAARRGIALD
jgi:lysylphosphatidylglycerol synthetase-like protein (DUF2156 family)